MTHSSITPVTARSILGVHLPFLDSEYAERVAKAKASMEAEGIDALLLFHQESMFYLFGYDQLGYWVYQTAILSREHEEITVVCREADVDLISGLPLVGEIHAWFDDSPDDPAKITIDTLRSLGILGPGRRVGIELRSHALLPFYANHLREAFGARTELVDASDLVTELRLRKSPSEIEYVRKAAHALDAAYEASFAAMRPGVRENQVLGSCLQAMFDAGGEVPAISPPFGSGMRTLTGTHGAATNKVLEPDEMVTIEVGACVERYHTVGVHSKWLGDPLPDAVEDHARLREALEVGIDLMKPGIPVADVARGVNDVLRSYDMYMPGRHIGYGTGIGYPPTWLDSLRVKESDPHVLEENMLLFVFLDHVFSPDKGLLFIGEPILIGGPGAERLSRVPFELALA